MIGLRKLGIFTIVTACIIAQVLIFIVIGEIFISPNIRYELSEYIKTTKLIMSDRAIDIEVKNTYLDEDLKYELTFRAWTEEEIQAMLDGIDVDKHIYGKINGVSSNDIREAIRNGLFSIDDLVHLVTYDPDRYKDNTLPIEEIAADIDKAADELGPSW